MISIRTVLIMICSSLLLLVLDMQGSCLRFILTPLISCPTSPSQSPEVLEANRISQEVVRLYAAGKFDEALPLAEQVLAIRERALGPEHEFVADALRNISQLLFATRKYKEAEATYRRALKLYEKTYGASDPRHIQALDRFVCLLIGANRRGEALEVQKLLYKLENGIEYGSSGDRSNRNLAAGGLMLSNAATIAQPVYSPIARQAGISGAVVLKIEVDERGNVVNVSTMCGHSQLVEGAEQAARRSRFTPTVVGGKAIRIKGVIIYNFQTS